VTQFPSKKYPVHSQLARRMGRGEGRPLSVPLLDYTVCKKKATCIQRGVNNYYGEEINNYII
jgi:hypothetical protein